MVKTKHFIMFVIMIIVMCIGLTFITKKAFANEKKDLYYDYVCEGVEKYYVNKDIGENNDLTAYYSEDIIPLLEAKIEIDEFLRKHYELEYKNYNIDIIPFNQENWSENGEYLYCELQIIRSWYYSSEPTTISEVLEIALSKKGRLCIDFCCEKYDSIIYGPIDEICKRNKDPNNSVELKNKLAKYVFEFKKSSIEKSIPMDNNMVEERLRNNNGEMGFLSITTLNRSSIKNWARNNYNKTNPTSSKPSVAYYDFSQIQNSYDCTNFVSHALLAGGATMNDKGQSGIQGTNQWYFRSVANRSSSWAGVNQLYTFLTRSNPGNSNIGPFATKKTVTYANAYFGDIVQGNSGGTWIHSTVVTNIDDNKVYVTGRTAPGVYNNNQLATTIHSTQRLLHLEGNYK